MRRYGGGMLYAALPLHMQRGCFRIQIYLNILSIGRYLIIYNATLSTRYDYLLPLSILQTFISNIISKLLAIIYKSGIIYKATTTSTNNDQHPRSTNINTGSIEPFYTTVIYDLLTHSKHGNKPMPLSLSLLLIRAPLQNILALLSLCIFLLEHQSPLFCRSPLLSKTLLQADV